MLSSWTLCALLLPLLPLLLHLLRSSYLYLDLRFILRQLRNKRAVMRHLQNRHTVMDALVDAARTQPDKPFLLFGEQSFSYRQADALSNQAARVLLQSGQVTQGDTVALLVGNQPVFVWLWLGLVKIGCSAAFLNIHIRSRSLLHCFNCTPAKTIVVSADLQDAVEEVLPTLLEQQVRVFLLTDSCGTPGVDSFLDKMSLASSEPLSKDLRSHLTMRSPACYIYTSGTTGLPKAAVISHAKLWAMTLVQGLAGARSTDVLYVPLPLYHTTGFIGITGAIERGMTVALRTKFSVSNFWDDCRKYNVTVIQYIGETMRYLCNTPGKPNDRSHKVRLAVGNGIRADVWRDFVSRFGNVKIREFYGATEGNMLFLNYFGKVGAIGRLTFLTKRVFKYALIKYNVEKDEPVRNSSGFCIEADKCEPGLLVSKITPMMPFGGYAGDAKQTEKKKLHDVFVKGDVYLNFGDLLYVDADNCIFFQDRVGDTFRWKGENVATTEVADVIMVADCIQEANVYGVKVPGHEGRIGMAAITLRDGRPFANEDVFSHVQNLLPSYARPRFMRIQNSLQVTGTYKFVKTKLVQEGFDPNLIEDPLYFLDEKEKSYVPLTTDIFNDVASGKIKM